MAEPSKKPGLMIALGLGKGKTPPDGESEGSMPAAESAGGDFDAAADALFDALAEQDREGFKAALKTAVMACSDESSEPGY